MRSSEWRIEWDVTGDSPRVLLDHGDLLTEEVAHSLEQLVAETAFDFAPGARIAGRGNARRQMEFSRVVPHTTAADSWTACSDAIADGPWGERAYLLLRPQDGTARVFLAALASSSHQPLAETPVPESRHGYAFRVTPVAAVISGGLVIIGGFFNSPAEYVFPAIPDGLPPGAEVEISGPGFPSGGYVVPGGVPSGGGARPVTPAGPTLPTLANLAPPVIAGDAFPGENLTATPGSWQGATSITGVWVYNGVQTGNTTLVYQVPSGATTGAAIYYREDAQQVRPDGFVSLLSANSNVKNVLAPFMNLTPPVIAGDGEPDAELTATPGTWQNADSVTGEWWWKGEPTGNATLFFTIPSNAEDGDQAFYRETAVRAGLPDLTASSNIITVESCDSCELHPVLVVTVEWADEPAWSWMPMVFSAIAHPPGLEVFAADYCSYEGEAVTFAASVKPEQSLEAPYAEIYMILPKSGVSGQGQFLFRRTDGSYAGNDYFDLPGECNEVIGTHTVEGLARNIDSVTLADPEP